MASKVKSNMERLLKPVKLKPKKNRFSNDNFAISTKCKWLTQRKLRSNMEKMIFQGSYFWDSERE